METKELDAVLAEVLPKAFSGSTVTPTKATLKVHSMTFAVQLSEPMTPHEIWSALQAAIKAKVQTTIEFECGPNEHSERLALIARVEDRKKKCQMSIRSTMEGRCTSFTVLTIHPPVSV